MTCAASLPKSSADMNWPGSGSPLEFTKCDWVRPSSLARAFSMSAKPASEPPRASATTTQASPPARLDDDAFQKIVDADVRIERHPHLGLVVLLALTPSGLRDVERILRLQSC